MAKTSTKLIANNKKAYHDYFILDTYEAGIALHGTEVKSLRMGKCSVKESFIRVENGEVLSMECISVHMRKEIFSTKTHFARESCCYIRQRSIKCSERQRKKGWRSCHSKYISKEV